MDKRCVKDEKNWMDLGYVIEIELVDWTCW